MNLKERIEKLLEGDNEEDWEIAVTLLASDEITNEERMKFIEEYFKENKPYYSDRDDKLVTTWIEANKNKHKN